MKKTLPNKLLMLEREKLIQYYITRILTLMAKIEAHTNEMFHVTYPNWDKHITNAIETKEQGTLMHYHSLLADYVDELNSRGKK